MANEVNKTIENIEVQKAMEILKKERDRILEEFTKAYLAHTNLNPAEVELVCQQTSNKDTIETIYFFRKKE